MDRVKLTGLLRRKGSHMTKKTQEVVSRLNAYFTGCLSCSSPFHYAWTLTTSHLPWTSPSQSPRSSHLRHHTWGWSNHGVPGVIRPPLGYLHDRLPIICRSHPMRGRPKLRTADCGTRVIFLLIPPTYLTEYYPEMVIPPLLLALLDSTV